MYMSFDAIDLWLKGGKAVRIARQMKTTPRVVRGAVNLV
ncbi:hypothetical protein RB2083_1638 [Rhodobacteraceae bacterium HTCC2083]|jgi:hypothetical protein|nr:hypothetical protein RB2083_1638 [Rhodobacteraceae bacterium HTCC2083]